MVRRVLIAFILLAGPMASGLLFAKGLELQPVSDTVYAIVGPHEQRSPQNLANNATFGFIVTEAGVILMDPGGSYQGAQRIHQHIKTVTDKPVKIVINTGGQDHRWLGNGYFKQQGARIIASRAAVADQTQRAAQQQDMLWRLVGEEGMAGTRPVYADETFDTRHELSFGGVTLKLHNPGVAHTPGDTYVWLPREKIVFSGDIVYMERMLAVGSVSNSKSWIAAFETLAALQPETVVPGHGHAAPLSKAKADTYDYLVALRRGVAELLDEGYGLESVSRIDQSAFDYLEVSDQLSGRNANAVYREMEWE